MRRLHAFTRLIGSTKARGRGSRKGGGGCGIFWSNAQNKRSPRSSILEEEEEKM